VVTLTAEEVDLWEQVLMAFGEADVVSRGRLATYGVMTSNIRHFVKKEMLEIEGSDIRIVRDVMVEERKPPVIRDVIVKETEFSPEDSSSEETWAVIQSFSPKELILFRCILVNTVWINHDGMSHLRLNPVKAAGFDKQTIIDLLNRFPGFDLHIGSTNIPIPKWWQDLLPQITLP